MRVNKISLLGNTQLSKLNIKKPAITSFKGDTFEKSSNTKIDYSKTVKHSIDWGWENFRYADSDFKVYFPLQNKLNILHANEDELKDIAESLCMYSVQDITYFTTIFNPLGMGVNGKKSEKAFNRLLPYVVEQKKNLLELVELKEKLEAKAQNEGLNELESKSLEFINKEIRRIDIKCNNAQKNYTKTEYIEVSDERDDGFGY